MTKRVNLAEYIERKNAAEGILVDLPDGKEITMPPAELWPETAWAALAESKSDDALELILGVEQHAAFTSAGGNWRILNGIMREQQGLDAGESEASSTS
jgi:hypothetical protein